MEQSYKEKYEQALAKLRGLIDGIREEKCEIVEDDIIDIFPELAESNDEKIRKELKHYLEVKRCITQSDEEYVKCNTFLAWLEKQGEQKPVEQQMYWTEEEIEPIISDYLCGREHYGGMIGRLCHLKPKQKPVWSEER